MPPAVIYKLYNKLPVSLQNLSISAFGYLWHRRRFGGIYKKEYEAFKERETFSADQWKEYQTKQLRKILKHAFQNVPYYRQSFAEAGISEASIDNFELEDIAKLPILEKTALRAFGTTTLLANKQEAGGNFYASSGSTGTPTSILYSLNMHQRISALYEARVRNWAGVINQDARGMIGGRRIVSTGISSGPFYRYNLVEKQVYFSAYHIGPSTVKNYLEGMLMYDLKYMVGYATSNYILARLIAEAGLKAPKMKAVLTSSEKLTHEMRTLLSNVYQCKVFDAWSGVEWCGLISENEFGQLLISPDSAYLEVIKPDGTTAKPGESGELVCTGFLNYDQPLIRYKIGDVIKLSAEQQTKCGRNFVIVDEIIGRSEDIVVGKDGRQMVRFHGIFINLPNVLKGQVVQETVDRFTINVATKGLTDNEKVLIRQRMESQLGEINLTIKELDEIPVGNNGKFKAVISNVKLNQHNG